MNFLRIVPLVLSLLAFVLPGYAQESTVVITDIDGVSVTLKMANNMEGYFKNIDSDGSAGVIMMVISIPKWVEDESGSHPVPDVLFEAPVNSVDEIVFNNYGAGVANVNVANVNVDLLEGVMAVSGVTDPLKVKVARIDGISLVDTTVSSDWKIDLRTSFGEGLYLVNVGGCEFKFWVK